MARQKPRERVGCHGRLRVLPAMMRPILELDLGAAGWANKCRRFAVLERNGIDRWTGAEGPP